MIQLEQDFLTRLELSKYIMVDMTQADRINLLDKYNKLAEAVINKGSAAEFSNDAENFRAVLNSQVFKMFIKNVPVANLQSYQHLYDLYRVCKNTSTKQAGGRDESAILEMTYNRMYNELCNKVSELGAFNKDSILDTNSVQVAIQTFGLNTSTANEQMIQEDSDIDDRFKDMFDDDELMSSLYDEDDEDDNDKLGIDELLEEEDDNDKLGIDELLEEDESTPDNEMPEEEPGKSPEEKEYFEAFKQVYEGSSDGSGTPLRAAIDGIMLSLRDLYMSCYSGITTPDGILTNKGLLSLDRINGKYKFVYNHTDIDLKTASVTSKEYIRYKTNSSEYNKRYKAAMYALGIALGGASEINSQTMDQLRLTQCIDEAVKSAEAIFGKAIDGRKSVLPKYEDAANTNYYPRLHTEFMTGNFNISKDMQEWAKDNKVRRNAFRITNFDDIMKWARVRVSDCLTQALIDAGLKIEDAGSNDGEVTAICQVMAKKIKNIVVITNSKKSHFTLKICTSQVVNSKILEKGIKDYFNAGSAGSKSTNVVIKNGGSESGVTELDIVLDMKDYEASSRLSAEVIDDILETGNVPSWSNAILGEKNNGGAFTYNFKNKYAIAIYGSSGSGKGIMTSALLTNAMAEGCAILYIDGKPDNGAALGKVAWDAKVEAPVLNGLTGKLAGGGCETFPGALEDYSHGLRDLEDRYRGIDQIPLFPDNKKWAFGPTKDDEGKITDETGRTNASRVLLYEVSMTLKAFQLVHDILIKRAMGGSNLEMLPNGKPRWAVVVIDEIEDAAQQEQLVRDKMKEYMDSIGSMDVYKTETNSKGEEVQKKDGKIQDYKNWSKDAGYLFCKQWLEWADNICPNWSTLITKSLRNSNATLITIFQKNDWFKQTGIGAAGKTKIGRLMLQSSAKVVRIIGRGGLGETSNAWGDNPPSNYTWNSEVNDHAKWVVAKGEGAINNEATIFKPFKVFTTDLGDKVPVPFDDYGAGTQNCWSSKEDKYDTYKHKPMGLQSYLHYLFNGLQPALQEQLQQGERLDGTLTPQGVLKTSFNYFNTLCGGNMVNDLYFIPPIMNFTGTIEESEAEQMAEREASDELAELNSGLNNTESEEQGEPIDFGDMPTQTEQRPDGQSPIPGQRENSLGNQQQTVSESILDQARKDEQDIKNLIFLTTAQLRKKNYSDNVLQAYIENILNRRNRLATNNFNYTDRDPRSPGGLRAAAIVFSSLCYMKKERGITNLDSITDSAQMFIQQLRDRNDRYKFMLGMIDDYLNNRLDYDELPTEDRMREYQHKFSPDIALDTGYSYDGETQSNYEGEPQSNYDGEPRIPEESQEDFWDEPQNSEDERQSQIINDYSYIDYDPSDTNDVFEYGNGPVINIRPTSTSDVVRLTMDDYIEASTPKWHTIEQFKKQLFESANGTAYEFKKRWDYVLKKIAERHPDRALVRKMVFTELHVIVNNKMLALNNIIGGDDDILVTDIIRIRDTFKKFPMIQQLTFDGPTTQCLIDEYGTTAQEVWAIFQENRAFKVLEFTIPGTTQQMVCRRETFPSTVDKFNQAMGVRVGLMQQEQFMSSYNPRMDEKSPGYISRVLKNKKSKASSWFEKQKQNMKLTPVAKKRMKYAAGTLGILTLGAIIGLPGLIATGVAGGIGYLKGSR